MKCTTLHGVAHGSNQLIHVRRTHVRNSIYGAAYGSKPARHFSNDHLRKLQARSVSRMDTEVPRRLITSLSLWLEIHDAKSL